MILVCPLCTDTEKVSRVPLEGGLWMYTCENNRAHSNGRPFSWQSAATDLDKLMDSASDDLAEELGLLTDLPLCLRAGDPWVEYGIVEHRFSEMKQDVFKELIDRYGHTRQGPKQYTASAFIAFTLGRLRSMGTLELHAGPATGYWSYNSVISYWALPPAPAWSSRLTYAEYAQSIGLDPGQ